MKSLSEIDDAELPELVRNAHGLVEMLWSTEELGAIGIERQQYEPPISKHRSETRLYVIARVNGKNRMVFVEPGSATAEEPRYGLLGEGGSDVPDPCEGENDWSVRGLRSDCSLNPCERGLPPLTGGKGAITREIGHRLLHVPIVPDFSDFGDHVRRILSNPDEPTVWMARPPGDLSDWLFGASGAKRRLIERVLAEADVDWTQAAIARALGLNPKGSIDEHLAALTQLGVLERSGTAYRLQPSSQVGAALRPLIMSLEPFVGTPFDRP